MLRRLLIGALTMAGVLTFGASAASATFHLMQIREVYPGSVASPGSEYVELQMWAEDQNHVAGHVLRTYAANGTVTGSANFLSDVPRGVDQSTMVLATPEAESEFGFAGDAQIAPSGRLDPGGGAVCWESIDCVAWGSFSGSLPSPAGAPATLAGIPDGMALRRSIATGCPTLLEPTDDHDNSAADLAAAFPGPRPNSSPPSEHACGVAAPGSAGGAGGTSPENAGRGTPETVLRHKPPRRSHDRTPTFRFDSDEAGTDFECRLDSRPFRICRSPLSSPRLAVGRHTFSVRAVNDSGQRDPSAATFAFMVLPRR